jgi:hypothetical protein
VAEADHERVLPENDGLLCRKCKYVLTAIVWWQCNYLLTGNYLLSLRPSVLIDPPELPAVLCSLNGR